MKRLLTYVKNDQGKAVLAPLFKCLEACFELFVPLCIARMIDVGIQKGDGTYILKTGLMLLTLAIVGLLSSITAQYFAARVAINVSRDMRKDLFHHLLSLSYSEIDSLGTSKILTRMTSDINQIENGLNMVLRLFMRSPFIVFGSMVMAFSISFRAALVFLITISLLTLVVFGILFVTMPMYRKVQRQLEKVTKTVRENVLGVRVVRAFLRQDKEKEDFKVENDFLTKLQVGVGKISALLNPVTYVIINLSVVLLLYSGARLVQIGNLSQGNVVALVNYMNQILVELIKLANLIILISRSYASLGRVNAVFDIPSEIEEQKKQLPQKNQVPQERQLLPSPFLEFKNVYFSYGAAIANKQDYSSGNPEGEVSASITSDTSISGTITSGTSIKERSQPSVLSDLSFKVFRGETIGVIGGTGSGKTSLINLIPRFYDLQKGAIFLNGLNLNSYPLKDLRMRVGMVPQKSVLFSGTLEENLRWGNEEATEEEMYKALTTAQALDFVKEKGEGLSLKISQEGKSLSGGQRQRICIARALVRNPDILILDDAASALDFATDAALRKAIKRESGVSAESEGTTDNGETAKSEETGGKRTVFIVSQRVSSVMGADKIIVLDDGRIAGLGTHEELLKSCGLYQEIYKSQLEERK